jgi:DNA-binding MarR family transcriptional regulator
MVNPPAKKMPSHGQEGPPFVGALLRIAWQRTRARIDEDIHAAGFTDLQDAHFVVFSWPPPDGVRLSQLARQIRMSRQATNYLVGQLEELGYLERRAPRGSDRRLIYLTKRSHKVMDTIMASLRALQAQWADEVGPERFDTFMDVLRELQHAPTRGSVEASNAKRRAA